MTRRSFARSKLVLIMVALALVISGAAFVFASIIDPAAPSDSSVTVLDTGTGAGSQSIITVGRNGLGVIAYLAGGTFNAGTGAWEGTGRVKLARCINAKCTSATLTTLATDAGLGVDQYGAPGGLTLPHDVGLAIGRDSLPLVTYYKGATADLMAVHCINSSCSLKTVTTLVSDGDVGRSSSVAIGPDGRPIVAYYDATTQGLKVVRCANVACTSTIGIEEVDDPPGDSPDHDSRMEPAIG